MLVMKLIEPGANRRKVSDGPQIFRQRYRQSVFLPAVTHVEETTQNDLLLSGPFFSQSLDGGLFKCGKGIGQFRSGRLAQLANKSLHVIVFEIRNQHTER